MPTRLTGFTGLTGLLAALLSGSVALADTAGDETYAMLFRGGTLDDVPRAAALVYAREVTNRADPAAAEAATGDVALTFSDEDPGRAVLRFTRGDTYRAIGAFPAEVGNPVVMYFLESLVRDMAESSGGSPFYIRNRLKEAVIGAAELAEVETDWDGAGIRAQALTLHPFENDPNRARMRGFADLAVTVTMSDAVPGWYHSLSATVPDPAGGAPLYASRLTLEPPDGEAVR